MIFLNKIIYFVFIFAIFISCKSLEKFEIEEIFPPENSAAPSLSFAGASGTLGTIYTAMSVTPTTLNNNGTAITSCAIAPALPAGITINASTCIISGTPTEALANTEFTITITNSKGSTNTTASLEVINPCPLHYVLVPARVGLGAFCVAQYEMKCEGANCGASCNNTCDVTAGRSAVSKPETTPWVNISQIKAKQACEAIGAGFDLISNPEWMAIAHEIENTASNWSGGSVGNGYINRGNSDSDSACAATAGEYTTGIGCSTAAPTHIHKRTHTLSNSQLIWDFAGNIHDWVDWSLGGGLTTGPTICAEGWTQFPLVTCGALSIADYMPENPQGIIANNYNSNYGLGQFYGVGGGGVRRGGAWNYGSYTGLFTLDLYSAPGDSYIHVGFRCVRRL